MHKDKVLKSIVSAPCPVKWMEVHDVYSLGATFQFQIRSVDECKEACIKKIIPGCMAIDVHGHFPHCFTHNQSLDNLEKSRKPQKGYTQLLLIEDCSSSTPTPTNNINESTLQSFPEAVESQPQSFTETFESKPQSFPEALESQPQSFTETVDSKPQSFPEAVESQPQSSTETVESQLQILTKTDDDIHENFTSNTPGD